MLVTVKQEGGRRVATKIAGDPDHPTTHGALCTKVARYLERTYHRDRLLFPLKRTGAKGKGEFTRVGWDEAIDDIATRLAAIAARDPQRIVPYSYAGTMGLVQGESMAARFFHKLGASHLDRTICASAGAEALGYTIGTRTGPAMEAFAESKLIVFWGTNAIASNLHLWSFAQQAKRNGAKLIAIDPYRSLTAEKCHEHIAPLPGTDAALALGVMHVLIREGWLDRDYIERYTLGFEALAARARRLSAGACRGALRHRARSRWNGSRTTIGISSPAAIRANYGLQRAHGGGNAVRAIACLPALAGIGAARGRRAAFDERDVQQGPRRAAASRSARGAGWHAAAAPYDQHEHDRRRLVACRSADRGVDRLQQQPGRRRAGVAARRAGFRT